MNLFHVKVNYYYFSVIFCQYALMCYFLVKLVNISFININDVLPRKQNFFNVNFNYF